MKALLILTALTATSSAFAGGKLLMRGDYMNNKTTQGSTESNVYSQMSPQNMMLNTDGKLGTAEFKLNLNLMSYTSSSPAALAWPQFIDQANISKGYGDWKFSAGKLGLLTGGFEADYVVSGTTYLSSMVNSGLVAFPTNQMGMQVDYAMGDHSLSFQGLNDTTGNNNTRRHSVGFNYKGAFWGKTLNVIAGQTAFATDNSTTKTLTATNVSLQYSGIENLKIDVEQFMNSAKADTSGAKADATNSLIAEVRYNMGAYTPVFKFENSEDKSQENASSASSKKRTGMSLALEVTPVEKDAFQYHLAYNSVSDTAGNSGATAAVTNTIYAGFTFTGDLWK